MKRISYIKGFTLIEVLVVIAIISLLSSVIAASLSTTRKKARDSQRIQNARQIAIALEQYEATNNTYKVANAGKNDSGYGYVAKGSGASGYNNSILSALKNAGMYNSATLVDPIYGTDNYYLGLCTSTNAYNVFVKLEQSQYNNSTTSISNTCGGAEASTLGFNFIASTVGGSSGGGGDTSGLAGSYESGMSAPVAVFVCGSSVVGPDGLTYGTLLAEDNKCWLSKNLGATRVATSFNDASAYGHLYQWGRKADGHQIRTSGVTTTLATTNNPGHSSFITTSSGLYDWLTPQSSTLWNKTTGLNNPCPSSFHIPSTTEWQNWYNSIPAFPLCDGNSNCHLIAFNSVLKLTTAGIRNTNATISNTGTDGRYWSSDVTGTYSNLLSFFSFGVGQSDTNFRSVGLSVRCLKD